MGNSLQRFLQANEEDVPTSGLSKADLDRLERRMRHLGRGRPELARSDLESVQGLAGPNTPFYVNKLFQLYDKDNDRLLTVQDMRTLLETICRSDEASRSQFAFSFFDADGDGLIDREELFAVFIATNIRGLKKSQLQLIVDSTMSQWDADGDGKLSFIEFNGLLSASKAQTAELLL